MSAVKNGVEWTEEEVNTLRSLVEAGIAPSKYASILGRSDGSIRAKASRSNISLGYLRKNWDGLMPRLLALQKNGYTYEEIAEIVQRSPNAVRGAFYRYRKACKLRAASRGTLRDKIQRVLHPHVDEADVAEVTQRILTLMTEFGGVANNAVNLKDV